MKIRNIIFLFALLPAFLFAQEDAFINPVIPGAHPDPSICRAGDDYYIVNSSFEYFPGLPVHHSKDLVNWELVGYGLHREAQASGAVNLVDVQQDGGIHAPTIRHHDGTFYIITTNVYSPQAEDKPTDMVNFIITADDPEGPWSEPHVIEGAPGIDPDLFFDDDGKVYFVGTHDVGNPNKDGIGEIWVQELDLENWKLTGERHSVWRGACGGCCVEGPHLYKENDTYYLLIAEGGTSFNHAVMIAASDSVFGPFDSNPRNPILTSRHLTKDYWVNSTGHADLVELPDGRWYMVALGIRNEIGRASNMGRETHLMPVTWEPATVGWEEVSEGNWQPVEYQFPVAAPHTGRVERYTPLPFGDKPQRYNDAFVDNFDGKKLDLEWNFRRVPQPETYSLTAREGFLRLYAKPERFEMREQYSLMGIRQKESDFEYSARMEFSPEKNSTEAGISLFQKDDNYMNFTVVLKNGNPTLQLIISEKGKEAVVKKDKILTDYKGEIILKVISGNDKYHFVYSLNGRKSFTSFVTTEADYILSDGYTGAFLGIYATGNGQSTDTYADFDWVNYKGHPRY